MGDQRISYTLEEASALVPSVRAVLIQLAFEKRRFDDEIERLRMLAASADDGASVATIEQQETAVREVGEGIKALAGHLEQLGVELRDVEMGLVDIPGERDGTPVWFCWRLADPEIGFWHTTRESFVNRRPL